MILDKIAAVVVWSTLVLSGVVFFGGVAAFAFMAVIGIWHGVWQAVIPVAVLAAMAGVGWSLWRYASR